VLNRFIAKCKHARIKTQARVFQTSRGDINGENIMRLIWKKQQRSPQARVERLHFVEQDFLKMFAAAIAVGIAFSTAAVGVALLLSYTSNANAAVSAVISKKENSVWTAQNGLYVLKQEIDRNSTTAIADENVDDEGDQATPGNLYIGDGCGGTPVVASERDWQITVKGKIAEIQVMQTFIMPADGVGSAYFHAVLPKGAQYSNFRMQTNQHDLIGQYANDTNWDADNLAEINNLKSKGMVRVFEHRTPQSHTLLSSDTVVDLIAGEMVIVTYRYQVAVDNLTPQMGAIELAINTPALTNDEDYAAKTGSTNRHETRTSIWMNWAGSETNFPIKMINAPIGFTLERTKRSKRIAAASWENVTSKKNQSLQLRWAI
jgi:hypothetical protein